jgi:DNA (cytosine-5)-methyltransferase 1
VTFDFIDLFSGIGGMTCGFAQVTRGDAQFQPIFAVELEERLAQMYRANFGDHIHVGDIRDVEHFPRADVVIGGPPCQGFSPLGRDRDTQSRALLNGLWRHFVRALEAARPEIFVMENVPELLRSGEYAAFKQRVTSRDLGYKVREGVLLAADFGVPQLRRRAIVIGSRSEAPPWPVATHTPDRYVTVRQALTGLPIEPDGRRWHRLRPNIRPTSIERYKAVPEGGNRFDLARNRPDLLPPCWRKKKTGTTDVFGRLWWDRPAVTIRAEFHKPEKGRYLHPTAHRSITVREAAVLQGFPRRHAKPPLGFLFSEDIALTVVAKGIGSAVPPPLARAIATAVLEYLCEGISAEPAQRAA